MSDTGDAQATGELTVAEAASVFETLLADDGDSQGSEPLEGEAPQAEEEAEAPETELEAEPEEQSEDDAEEGEATQEKPATVTVKVDGKETQVTLDEVVRGYQREADYSRKTMAHGEEVKAFNAEKASFQAERERTTNLLKALEDTLQAPAYTPEQLDYLRATNPAEYAATVADQMQRAEQARLAQAERQRLEGLTAKEREAEKSTARQTEQAKLVSLRPEWKDPEKAKAALSKARDYANALGVTDEELRNTFDHRLIVALHEASQWRDLQAKKPAVQAKVEQVKTAKPGSAVKVGKATDVTRAQQRLAQTGRVEDAAAVFLHLSS